MMDWGSLRFRFEQRRGHYLVVEGPEDRPLTRRDCDEFQLRMLTACEVPGLLKLEAEEIDGRLSLRYALTGTRMLSQVMRANKTTMAAYMGALCRLAEVMEDCRLYVLSPERLMLADDRIFVGQAGEQDLKFVYLPIPAERADSASGMETLIVRWLLQVADPDGQAIQQSLRIAASPEFKPAALSRFARAYLAGRQGAAFERPDQPAGTGEAATEAKRGNGGRLYQGFEPGSRGAEAEAIFANAGASGSRASSDEPAAPGGNAGIELAASGGKTGIELPVSGRKTGVASAAASSGWRWFPPVSNDANGMSALLGDDSEPYGEAPDAPDAPAPPPPDRGRRQVVVLCAAVGIIAIAWRWGYAASPGTAGLSVSLGLTVAVLAAAGWLSVSYRRTERHGARESAAHDGIPVDDRIAGPIPARPEDHGAPNGISREEAPMATAMAAISTSWEQDRTQYLASDSGSRESSTYYLECETEPHAVPIPLTEASLIIGRSREAAGHVDVTPGVSRAHVELLHTGQGWTATDLGSRNGSRLNGEAMVAYEAYPLQPDDTIELAGAAVYRLKFGKMQRQAS